MLARMRVTCASPSSCVTLPFSTSFAAWLAVTSRAFASPASTNRRSTSLRMTGMSAAAITCAISPPITPAPTTAALKTNIAMTLAALLAFELQVAAALVREAGERAAQRAGDLAANEQHVGQPRQRGALLELVVERERDADRLRSGGELDALRAAQPLVFDAQCLSAARLVRGHRLEHEPAPARLARPLERPRGRPLGRQVDDVAEAVDPGGPADRVVPERLRVGGQAGNVDRRRRAAHQPSTSSRIASIERTIRSSRGPSSRASRSRSARPAGVIR